MATTDNEGSIKGKGPEIMLPSRGSPFPSASPEEAEALSAAATGAESPAAGALSESGAPPEQADARDLTPEEVAALFSEAAPAPGADGDAAAMETMEAEPVMAEPDLSAYAAAPDAGAEQDLSAYAAAPDAGAEQDPSAYTAEQETAAEPAGFAEPAYEADVMPDEAEPDTAAAAAVAVAAAPAEAGAPEADDEPAAVAVAAAAVTTDGAQAAAAAKATAALQLSEDVGVAVSAYERPAELRSKRELVDFFVTDGRLMELWLQIESVEAEVINSRASRKLVIEMLDRLATARNMLLNERDRFENAQREVAHVRYMVQRLTVGGRIEYPSAIVSFLALYLVLLVLGFVSQGRIHDMIGQPDTLVGIPFAVLWNSIMWGGLGGLSASFYALIRHVEDYDPQHARWYYLSPVMGLIFGPLIAMLAQIGAQIGVSAAVTVSNGQPTGVQVNPIVLYFLAWVVGFQQNLLLKLINSLLARLYPGDEEKKEKSVTQETKTVVKTENG